MTTRVTGLFAAAALLCASAARGQVGATEYRVNDDVSGIQRDPHVDADSTGAFVVVWTRVGTGPHAEDVYLRRFDASGFPLGGQMRVNDEPSLGQFAPAVAVAADGRFVVAWTSHVAGKMLEVRARVFGADGEPVGEELNVNTTPDSSQANPDVAMDEAGNFCIVWHSWFQDGGDRGVYGRCFAEDGSQQGGEFRVNETTAFSQANPAVAMAGDGRFVVAWESWNDDGAGTADYDVYTRLFLAGGGPAGPELRVNQATGDDQWHVDVDMRDDGSYVVVWTSWEQDGDDGAVMMREFDSGGLAASDEITVNTTSAGYQWLPSVVVWEGSQFADVAVSWSSWKQDGDREGVYVREYQNVGSVETRVNTVASGFQWEPSMARGSESEAIIVWSSWGQGSSDYDIYARRLAFIPVGTEQVPRLNTATLHPNYPNPFTDRTRLVFTTTGGPVRLEIADVLGRTVRLLAEDTRGPGVHQIEWDGRGASGRSAAAGVYICRLTVEGQTLVRKMIKR